MKLKEIFCGFLAALMLTSCVAEEDISAGGISSAPAVSEGWQTFSWQADGSTDLRTGEFSCQKRSFSVALPDGWTLDGDTFTDEDGESRGMFDGCFTGYHGELNCNDFYMMLELDGHVTENGVNGSRRRFDRTDGNIWRQGIYGEDCIRWEYYLWTQECHLRVFFCSDTEEDHDEELCLAILDSIT